MQLRIIPNALSVLGAFGLGLSAAHGQATSGETKVNSDVLLYSDTDQVMVVSPQVGIKHVLEDEEGEIGAQVVLDAITAASVDVVSNATYRFSELRKQADFSMSRKVGESLPSISYRYSHEPDYQSHSLGLGVSRDFADKDANLGVRYSLTVDSIGRSGTPRSVFNEELQTHSLELSFTQNIDEKSVLRFVYSLTAQDGYMEKPYRSVAFFDAAGLARARMEGAELGLQTFDRYRLPGKAAEEVPDRRYRHAAALRYLRYIESLNASLRLDYRFYGDSWRVFGHTVEPAVYAQFSEKWRGYLWSRFHMQDSAFFWNEVYEVPSASVLPQYRSSDRSLSANWHLTGGGRAEYSNENFSWYLEPSLMYSSFHDFLYLDSRIAVIFQGGLRWQL